MSKKGIPSIDVFILTPITIEFESVRVLMINTSFFTDDIFGRSYCIGAFQSGTHAVKIALRKTKSGHLATAKAVQEGMQLFKPQLLVLFGTAGGLKKAKTGDIIVATAGCSYESGRVVDNGFYGSSKVLPAHQRIVEKASTLSNQPEYWKRTTTVSTIHQAEVHFGLIVPSDLRFGDQLDIQINATYNSCLEYATTTSLSINALNVCLTDVRLIDIRYLPTAIWWNPGALPIFWDPDVYFGTLGPGLTLLHRSMTIEDVIDDWPNTPILADWLDLTPCIHLTLDSTYTITFWDEDIDADDFIGTVSFQAVDYLAEQDQIVTITNDEVIMELYFEWQ